MVSEIRGPGGRPESIHGPQPYFTAEGIVAAEIMPILSHLTLENINDLLNRMVVKVNYDVVEVDGVKYLAPVTDRTITLRDIVGDPPAIPAGLTLQEIVLEWVTTRFNSAILPPSP